MIAPGAPAPNDMPALLALNNAHAVETSELTRESFAALIATSFRTRIIRPADALLIALDQTAAYDNPNFSWFHERNPRFVYIDRVIVAGHAQGRGLARALYADLSAAAKAAGHTILCCEINSQPQNPASDAFHAALGFAEVGRAELPGRGKTVRYLTLAL